MTTAQEVEEHANRIAMLGMGQSVVLLRQYAAILRQTTEGTDLLVAAILNDPTCVASEAARLLEERCRAYEQRLKVVEAETVERCAVRGRIAQLEGKLVDVEIRALKVERRRGASGGSNVTVAIL